MGDSLIETWHIRINLYLLDAVATAALGAVSALKGRTVSEQLAHIHNVRLLWLTAAAPDPRNDLEKIDKGDAGDRHRLASTLSASAGAIEALLRRGLQAGGWIKS
jgi:uncharacterized damage-inducible protein DinB